MKEDKLDKEIAASLKEKLAEASVPYELGAWEAFQKKRGQRKRRQITYWVSGIAASLLLLAVGLNSFDLTENGITNSPEIQLADGTTRARENKAEHLPLVDREVVEPSAEPMIDQQTVSPNSGTKLLLEGEEEQKSSKTTIDPKVLNKSVRAEKAEIKEDATILPVKPLTPIEKGRELDKERISIQKPPLIAETKVIEKAENQMVERSVEESLALTIEESATKVEEPLTTIAPSDKQQFVAESDFPEIEKEKSNVGLGMGLSPGFGAIQNDNQVATAQTIGLGMLVDIKLPGKFTLGSGLGLNYLSQNTEQQSTVMAFGNSYPQTEKLEIRQMQLEVPVFIKYPLTKNNSISVQAGFSNYYALNESGRQENSYDRQVASYSVNADGFSSVSLSSKSMNSAASLEATESKFYPFATINFGLNLLLLESKSASYVIMPFYNYQLKQVSGYGDTYGLFGASFKMNFGGNK
ncbi:hypothetical protein LV84_00298 [Algoriphagus ratkowskyi]|uniref:PorT family protein n=1 Tax=Algoriphagus ratkowskyi TaxID=57028 RepID=A0A2W7RRZ9_9BACT|nr:hypothetical protein [Algoriphagus ratkowskyi]PZX61310.1 hypothetical protein LV84_00298 [Algoriphagus ratkowskyi]TXD79418.1 PorT family protein [Algoriphagus ratkowskyi]